VNTAAASWDDVGLRFGLGEARVMPVLGFIHVDKGLKELVRALGNLHVVGCAQPCGCHLVVNSPAERTHPATIGRADDVAAVVASTLELFRTVITVSPRRRL
jgi:hypothetical protein